MDGMNDNQMTDDEIVSHLRKQADDARTFYNSDLADRQANALDFYDSEPFGDERDGCSQYIEPVVEQAIDDMTVDIMEAFVSGDRVVELEANDEESEEAASQATEAIHYLFMRKQRGYKVTLDWLQSGLVETIGIMKVACVEEKKRTKKQGIIPDDQLAMLDEDSITAAQDNGDGTHTVEITEDGTVKRYMTMPIPSEQFLFSPRMKSLDEKLYKAHMCRKTASDLIEMGFDRDIVSELTAATEYGFEDSRENARWRDNDQIDRVSKEYLLYEEYDYIDMDGDGITELVRAYRVEDVLLSVEPWEEQPFVSWTPYPRAHRMAGKSLAEKVMPDQRIESLLTRQMLDGVYASNAPRRWLPLESTGDNTIEDLLNVRPNAIVRGKGLTPPANLSENFDISKSLTVLQRFSDRRQNRTGLTDLGRGMDKNAMNDTASGQAQLMQAGEKQIRYVARNFGEAMAEMFLKLMRLVRSHGEQMTIKVGKKYTPIDPSQWPEDMDFSIRVGLGTNGKDKRIAYRMQIVQMQAEAQAMGSGLVMDKHLFNSADGIIRDMGLGEPSDYFADPEAPPEVDPATGEPAQKQEKPDPEMAKVEADAALRKQKLDADIAMSEAKMEMASREQNHSMQLATERAQFEADLAERKAAFEADLARNRADVEQSLAMQKVNADLPNDRPGGSLAA